MNTKTILITVGIVAVAGIGGYSLSKTEFFDSLTGNHDNTHDHIMAEGTEPKETITSDIHGIHNAEVLTEKEFITHMIPHHQEAVDTAMEVLARGENPEVRALAEAIVVAQEKEISDMKTWYQSWYGEAYKSDDSYEPMMRDLSTLSGNDLDRAFLEDMIPHHLEALTMAQRVVPKIEHSETQALVTTIAESQSEEIISMRILLKQI